MEYLRALRVHQWTKNLLIFVPIFAAHSWDDPKMMQASLLAFSIFSLAASGIYIVNDLIDLESDRAHPRKRFRPFASGALPVWQGRLIAAFLVVLALAISLMLGRAFSVILLGYVVMTTAYSLLLKRYVLIDVITLAALYAVRVIAGGVATGISLSFWLISFFGFFFLSLALVKRCSELVSLEQVAVPSARGRDYNVTDRHVLQSIGVAGGIGSVIILALYLDSEVVRATYASPQILWFLCVTVFYSVMRLWIKTARGQMHDDPIIFVMKDRAALTMLVVSAAIVFVAAKVRVQL